MIDCSKLVHPFQNDPGVSQSQRIMAELLTSAPKIDERTLADLLDYFTQIASDINYYYDDNLQITDWKPFFKNSIPFLLASIINIKTDVIDEKFTCYNNLVKKDPSQSGLQLNLFYTYYNTFKKINAWQLQLTGSKLPVELFIGKLIKNKLKQSLITFIKIANTAVKYYCIKKIDFTEIINNNSWGIQQKDLFAIDDKLIKKIKSNRKRLLALQNELNSLFPVLLEAIKTLAIAAANDLQTSLTPQDDDLQKKNEPHLALIFVFLKMFEKLRGDLNGFTKKHLDFFYQNVLQLKPEDAVPDKANIVFQLQNQVQQYLIKKGTLVKDGKDNNKAQILFSLDDEIVVNKTQVTDVRTLFLNNQTIHGSIYIEGVYMATDATKADGIAKEFKDNGQVNSYPTVGAKNSKYIATGTDFLQPYPNGRLGFILASPVLFLNEGVRTIIITLSCKLKDNCGQVVASTIQPTDPCCKGDIDNTNIDEESYPDFISTAKLYDAVEEILPLNYIYITEELLQEAEKKGITTDITDSIRTKYLTDKCKKSHCCENKPYYKESTIADWPTVFSGLTIPQQKILLEIFLPRKAFKVLFSGEKDWIEPVVDLDSSGILQDDLKIGFSVLAADKTFTITITAIIKPDKPAITFYNKDNLKEDFNTTQPLVKIELDDSVKIPLDLLDSGVKLSDMLGLNNTGSNCCLDRKVDLCGKGISLYNFFKNVIIDDTTIEVKVCGLKNFIVQNDESVQDVNSPIYAFGTRPKLYANFYIGSKEIFYKDWTECFININWKDRPDDFEKYYEGYENNITSIVIGDFANSNFRVQKSLLNNGKWLLDSADKLFLFPDPGVVYPVTDDICSSSNSAFEVHLKLSPGDFSPQYKKVDKKFFNDSITRYDVSSSNGFVQLTLLNVSNGTYGDFQHYNYPFILARQMMAFGRLPDVQVEGAVYFTAGGPIVFDANAIKTALINSNNIAERVRLDVNDDGTSLPTTSGGILKNAGDPTIAADITAPSKNNIWKIIYPDPSTGAATTVAGGLNLTGEVEQLKNEIVSMLGTVNDSENFQAIIPNEPWTPIISNMSLDYTAQATAEDIDLIHLYPYDGTYMPEEIQLQPTLFPTFCDEGTLFLGLQDLVPGDNLNILFQLAEATSDSESEQQDIYWYYLVNNTWQPLRNGFEVLNDDTKNLTTKGIIKFSLPENISNDNTIMPKGLHWIKAGIPKNSGDVSETIGIDTQAISVTFTNDDANDKLRLNTPLPSGSISKLNIADANIKEVDQPYDTFGGAIPELESQYYVRVSELLRHKGRAIQKFDYERMVLQQFPELFKAKCINHSFALNAHDYINDFPFAPGYVLLAVIPDLNKLKAGNSFQPKTPVSILEKIEDYLKARTSPFVRFRAMNPRYETVDFCITVKLLPEMDRNYYKKQLAEDIREFMAPWAVGDYYKLTFGQCVNRSNIIEFLETTDYVDYILELKMFLEGNEDCGCDDPLEICPLTPRSILIAGDIEVCIASDNECEKWSCIDICYHHPVPVPVKNNCKEIVKTKE